MDDIKVITRATYFDLDTTVKFMVLGNKKIFYAGKIADIDDEEVRQSIKTKDEYCIIYKEK